MGLSYNDERLSRKQIKLMSKSEYLVIVGRINRASLSTSPSTLLTIHAIDEDYGGYCETYLELICKMEHIFACHV